MVCYANTIRDAAIKWHRVEFSYKAIVPVRCGCKQTCKFSRILVIIVNSCL